MVSKCAVVVDVLAIGETIQILDSVSIAGSVRSLFCRFCSCMCRRISPLMDRKISFKMAARVEQTEVKKESN